jgi:hypothetical protein
VNKPFWEVRTPYGHRRTLFVVAHASETRSIKPSVVCGVAEKPPARSHQAYSHRAAARAAQKGHLRDKALDPDRRILSRGCAIRLCRTGNLTAGLLYLWGNLWCDSRASVGTAEFVAGVTLAAVSFASNRPWCVHVCVSVSVRVSARGCDLEPAPHERVLQCGMRCTRERNGQLVESAKGPKHRGSFSTLNFRALSGVHTGAGAPGLRRGTAV